MCKKLFNIDPTRELWTRNMDIEGIPRWNLILYYLFYKNYITPFIVDYLGIPQVFKHYPYFLEGYRVLKSVNVLCTRDGWMRKFGIVYLLCILYTYAWARKGLCNIEFFNKKNWPKIVMDQWGSNHFSPTFLNPMKLWTLTTTFDNEKKILRGVREHKMVTQQWKKERLWGLKGVTKS